MAVPIRLHQATRHVFAQIARILLQRTAFHNVQAARQLRRSGYSAALGLCDQVATCPRFLDFRSIARVLDYAAGRLSRGREVAAFISHNAHGSGRLGSAMKFVLASYGTRGWVEPCAAAGRELLDRGHEVRM